jgi:hypothetical protein
MAKETIEEYKKRISGLAAGKDPLKIQSTTIAHIERLIQGVSNEKLAKRPAPDKWSITEILAHLSETELVGGYRMRSVIGRAGLRDYRFRSGQLGCGREVCPARPS